MDEDQILQSIIADPQLTDPSIDVGQLRQTTPTRAELLADVPEFSGLKFDPTQRSYIEDLYTLYGGGAPMLPEPVVDTPVVDTTPIVDTSAMDQPAGDSVLDTTPTDSGLTESGTFAGQPTFTTTPGTTVDNVTGDITNPDGSFGGNIVDEFATPPSGITGDSIEMENLSPIDIGTPDDYDDLDDYNRALAAANVSTTISGAPVVSPVLTNQGPITIEGSLIPGDIPGVNPVDEVALTGTGTPEQQEGFLQNVLGRAGQTVEGALNELGKVPGAVVDFANQTVDVFGRKLNVGRTLAAAAINKVVGGPISLVFDVLGAIAPKDTPEQSLTRSIVSELQAEKNYGFNMGNKSIGQDIFGRNPVSLLGNYEQTLLEDATSTGTTKMALAKKEFAQDYFDKKAGKIAPQEDIGSVPGGGNIVDEFDTTNEAAVNIGTPSFEGFDSGGFDPAPAPAPAPAPNYDSGGGGGRDSGGGSSTAGDAPGYSGPSPFKKGGKV